MTSNAPLKYRFQRLPRNLRKHYKLILNLVRPRDSKNANLSPVVIFFNQIWKDKVQPIQTDHAVQARIILFLLYIHVIQNALYDI